MRSVFLFAIILLSSCRSNNDANFAVENPSASKVIRVADGDTFTFLHADNTQEKIRLYGIDAPEQGQDFGTAAKKALSDLVFGKKVRIESKGKDKYRRTLAIVYTPDGKCVNEELLKRGMAWHFKRFDKNPAWAAMEAKARSSRVGLWSKEGAVAPSLYRDSR